MAFWTSFIAIFILLEFYVFSDRWNKGMQVYVNKKVVPFRSSKGVSIELWPACWFIIMQFTPVIL